MPKIVDAAEQRAHIRKAARRVLSRGGMAGSGLNRVAREAGISRSSLYHYYDDKSALMRDVARELLEEEEALFRESLLGPGSPVERIEALAERVVARFTEWSRIGGALLQLWLDEQRHVRRLLRQLRSDLGTLVRAGQQAGEIDGTLDAEATATLLIGMIDGLVLQVFLDPRALPSQAQMRRALVHLLHRGLQKEHAE